MEKFNVKGWFSKEMTKGQQIPMESTEAKNGMDVHRKVDGVVSLDFVSVSDRIPHCQA